MSVALYNRLLKKQANIISKQIEPIQDIHYIIVTKQAQITRLQCQDQTTWQELTNQVYFSGNVVCMDATCTILTGADVDMDIDKTGPVQHKMLQTTMHDG